jgi:ELWxxDGT repeat protein
LLALTINPVSACSSDSDGGDGYLEAEGGTPEPSIDAGVARAAGGGTVDPAGFAVLSTEAIEPSDFVEVGERVFFTTLDSIGPGADRDQLWVTDGTPAGTRRLLDAQTTDGCCSRILAPTATATRLFFFAHGDEEEALWVSDGTVDGTRRLQTVFQAGRVLAIDGDRIFFVARTDADDEDDLWVSDGTIAGTYAVAEGPPGFWFMTEGGVARFWKERLYMFGGFTTEDVSVASALLATDGTPGNLEELTPRTDPGPLVGFDMMPFGDHLYFTWTSPQAGTELWRTDSDGGNASMFVNLYPDDFTALGEQPQHFGDIGDALLFSTSGNPGLWRTDGTEGGTQRLAELEVHPTEGGFVEVGGRWYFAASRLDDQHPGWELWATDGTAAGTSLVSGRVRASVIESQGFTRQYPQMVRLGSRILFEGGDEAFPAAPWSSDGSDTGTTRLLDAFFRGGYTGRFTVVGEKAYFVADISPVGGEDKRLFETDGTVEGTHEIRPATAVEGADPIPYPGAPARAGGTLVVGANFTDAGHVLWSHRPGARSATPPGP